MHVVQDDKNSWSQAVVLSPRVQHNAIARVRFARGPCIKILAMLSRVTRHKQLNRFAEVCERLGSSSHLVLSNTKKLYLYLQTPVNWSEKLINKPRYHRINALLCVSNLTSPHQKIYFSGPSCLAAVEASNFPAVGSHDGKLASTVASGFLQRSLHKCERISSRFDLILRVCAYTRSIGCYKNKARPVVATIILYALDLNEKYSMCTASRPYPGLRIE